MEFPCCYRMTDFHVMFTSIPENEDMFRHVSTYCMLSDIQRITLGYFYSLCSIDSTWIFVKNIDVYMCGMLSSQSKNMQPVTVKITNSHAFATLLYRDELKTKNILIYIYHPILHKQPQRLYKSLL